MEFDADLVTGQKTNIYFGNPLTVSADVISPVISSSSLKSSVKIGDTTVKKPLENLDKLLQAIADTAPEAEIVPIVYDSDENSDDIIAAIESSDAISGYILSDDDNAAQSE